MAYEEDGTSKRARVCADATEAASYLLAKLRTAHSGRLRDVRPTVRVQKLLFFADAVHLFLTGRRILAMLV